MRVCTLVVLLLAIILTLNVLGQCEGWWGGGSRSSSSRSSSGSRSTSRTPSSSSKSSSSFGVTKTERGITVKAFGQTAHFGKIGIRDRDKTGHRTGLGTLARKMFSQPEKTKKAGGEFRKSYDKMRKANVIGGNLAAHEEANRKATEVAGKKTSAAYSALREQYKGFRVKQNPDGSWHFGDTRTQAEIDKTMDANRRGRENANQG